MESSTLNQLKWCRNVADVIVFKTPSSNLSLAHFEQAKKAIKSMNANLSVQGLDDWVITTSYYAKYFAVSALLDLIGLKCENHTCVAALFDYLLSGTISRQIILDFMNSRENRIDAQYDSASTGADLNILPQQTKTFVLEMERLAQNIKPGSKLKKELENRIQNLKSI